MNTGRVPVTFGMACRGAPGPRVVAAVLCCVECGCCSGELGRGWVAFRCDDPDDGDGPEIAIWCPICAAEEFGYRPDIAATYVRGWEPLPSEIEGS